MCRRRQLPYHFRLAAPSRRADCSIGFRRSPALSLSEQPCARGYAGSREDLHRLTTRVSRSLRQAMLGTPKGAAAWWRPFAAFFYTVCRVLRMRRTAKCPPFPGLTSLATMSSQTTDESLSDRAQQLLKLLVEHYIADGQPVGSRTLSRDVGMSLRAATIRNVMADLEELGFVHSPHTSAGRIPTDKGYRFFVARCSSSSRSAMTRSWLSATASVRSPTIRRRSWRRHPRCCRA